MEHKLPVGLYITRVCQFKSPSEESEGSEMNEGRVEDKKQTKSIPLLCRLPNHTALTDTKFHDISFQLGCEKNLSTTGQHL